MMYPNDPLYFHRADYARKLLNSLHDGITHAFTLFAPRRMGKTQFLLRDVAPLAEDMGFNVFYFSFMDDEPDTVVSRFQAALHRFAADNSKIKTFIASIKKLDIAGSGLERDIHSDAPPVSTLIGHLAAGKRQTLLLLDEVQELAHIKGTSGLIRALRTGLDVNQQQVKTIFTGSSTNALHAMFNDSKAPFFHFAHALDFPVFGREFTDFLATVYAARTGRELDGAAFYAVFERLNKTPMYMRAVTQDMIVNPALQLDEAMAYRMAQMQTQAGYWHQWAGLKPLERAILADIAQGGVAPYSHERRGHYAALLGVQEVGTSQVQSSIKRLARQDLLTRDTGGNLQINSPALQTWLLGLAQNPKSSAS